MTNLIGERVRFTLHAPDGTAHTVDGELAALASGPGVALTPHEPAPWACLVRIDEGRVVVPYNACELTFLPATGDAAVFASAVDALQASIDALDDENATLTAALAGARKQIETLNAAVATLTEAHNGACKQIDTLNAAVVTPLITPDTSKIANATKSGKGKAQ